MKFKRVVLSTSLIVMLFMALGGVATHASGLFSLDIRYSVSVLQEGTIERGVILMDIFYRGEDTIENANLMIENLPQLIFIEGEIALAALSPEEPITLSVLYELDRSGGEVLTFDDLRWVLTYEDPVGCTKIEVIQGINDDTI